MGYDWYVSFLIPIFIPSTRFLIVLLFSDQGIILPNMSGTHYGYGKLWGNCLI